MANLFPKNDAYHLKATQLRCCFHFFFIFHRMKNLSNWEEYQFENNLDRKHHKMIEILYYDKIIVIESAKVSK